MSSSNSFSAGFTGSRVISNTSANTGTFRGFVVNFDCVVTACLDKDGNTLMATLGLSGVILNQGAFISVADGDFITSITLSSGSIIAYNR